MSHDTSRKHFLAKVLGLATVGALVPKAVVKAIVPESRTKVDGKPAAFRLSPQPRAVTRRDGAA